MGRDASNHCMGRHALIGVQEERRGKIRGGKMRATMRGGDGPLQQRIATQRNATQRALWLAAMRALPHARVLPPLSHLVPSHVCCPARARIDMAAP